MARLNGGPFVCEDDDLVLPFLGSEAAGLRPLG